MKLIKFDKFDKPCLQSQHEIKITTNLIKTPKQSQSQTFITFKSPLSNSTKHSIHLQSNYLMQYKSQFSQLQNQQNKVLSQQNAFSIVQECILILSDLKSTCPLLFANKKLTSKVEEKMFQISNIVDQMLPQDSKEEKKRLKTQNHEKIQHMMKLLMQEKQQKYQAIKSGENLIKQQKEQIQSLKTRISLYRPSHDDI